MGGSDTSKEEVRMILKEYYNNFPDYNEKYQQLKKQKEKREKEIQRTLKRLKLQENPFWFFQNGRLIACKQSNSGLTTIISKNNF